VFLVALHPDNAHLALCAGSPAVAFLRVWELSSLTPTQISNDGDAITNLEYSSDGNALILVTADGVRAVGVRDALGARRPERKPR
jgi:hypothetical protein